MQKTCANYKTDHQTRLWFFQRGKETATSLRRSSLFSAIFSKISLSTRGQRLSNIQDIPSLEKRAVSELYVLPLIAHHSCPSPPEMTSDGEDFFTITVGFQTTQRERAPRYWLFKQPGKSFNGRFHSGLDIETDRVILRVKEAAKSTSFAGEMAPVAYILLLSMMLLTLKRVTR